MVFVHSSLVRAVLVTVLPVRRLGVRAARRLRVAMRALALTGGTACWRGGRHAAREREQRDDGANRGACEDTGADVHVCTTFLLLELLAVRYHAAPVLPAPRARHVLDVLVPVL